MVGGWVGGWVDDEVQFNITVVQALDTIKALRHFCGPKERHDHHL